MTKLLAVNHANKLSQNVRVKDYAMSLGVPLCNPFTFWTNSVLVNKLDPFKLTLIVPSFDEINAIPSSTISFEELCFRRAEELYRMNKRIYLKYSGGTDSTVALLSIIRSWPSQDVKDRVFLLATEDSVDEFPEFWPELEVQFNNKLHDSREEPSYFHENGIIVNGEVGDQLFGSSMIQLVPFHTSRKPWRDVIHKVLWEDHLRWPELLLNRYEKTLEYCPFPIKTLFDFLWWLSYTNKVQNTYLRDMTLSTLKTYTKCVYPFFLTEYFLRWSLDNHDLKIENSIKSYKPEAKRFIEKYTGFNEHWPREKVGSRNFIWMKRHLDKATKWKRATSDNPIVKDIFRLEGISTDFEPVSATKTISHLRSKEEYGEYF